LVLKSGAEKREIAEGETGIQESTVEMLQKAEKLFEQLVTRLPGRRSSSCSRVARTLWLASRSSWGSSRSIGPKITEARRLKPITQKSISKV